MRDFIPADEETTDEERTRWSAIGGISFTGVRADFIPDPDEPKVEDVSADEKTRIAREAAGVEVREEVKDALAREKLDKLGTRAAIEYIEDLSEPQRNRFVRVERDNRQRVTILKHFNALPDVAIKDSENAETAEADKATDDEKGDVPGKDEKAAKAAVKE